MSKLVDLTRQPLSDADILKRLHGKIYIDNRVIPQNSARLKDNPRNSKITWSRFFSWENRAACAHGIFKMPTQENKYFQVREFFNFYCVSYQTS